MKREPISDIIHSEGSLEAVDAVTPRLPVYWEFTTFRLLFRPPQLLRNFVADIVSLMRDPPFADLSTTYCNLLFPYKGSYPFKIL